MKIKILDRASMGMDIPVEDLRRFGELEVYNKPDDENLEKILSDAEAIIINKVKIDEKLLSLAPKLRFINVFATGYDNIDIASARARGIAVCNVPAYSTSSVCEYTVATVLALSTRLNSFNQFVRSGEYTASGVPNRLTPAFNEINGKTWGIIGYGNIGRAVGRVASAFGCKLLVNKRVPMPEVQTVDIDTLCANSDIITVHCPLNEQTRGLINRERLSLMKKTCILVNEARGAVLDSDAVAEAIEKGRISAFGADVYEQEPFGNDHPFNRIKQLDNVLLTPHSAWAAYEARCRCLNIIMDNLTAFIEGKTLNRVDI